MMDRMVPLAMALVIAAIVVALPLAVVNISEKTSLCESAGGKYFLGRSGAVCLAPSALMPLPPDP